MRLEHRDRRPGAVDERKTTHEDRVCREISTLPGKWISPVAASKAPTRDPPVRMLARCRPGR